MLTGIHFILTYTCNFECDHCFLYSSPKSQGTFTISQVTEVLDEAVKIGTIKSIFYEGGEPFMFFPLLVESIKLASARGFRVGIVTNAYGANSEEDAELWLRPLAESGVSFLNISNDAFHYGEEPETPATIALSTA
ncbi:MAG: radical SAM protein, partial [Planctomycetes bacterium]|nr:radical SAM protein [Planctomycetota bacterium]